MTPVDLKTGLGWLPFTAGVLAAGSLLATILTFSIVTSSGGDPAVAGAAFVFVCWLGFVGLSVVLVLAGVIRMRAFKPVTGNAGVFDVLLALAVAFAATLALVTFWFDGPIRRTLWIALTLGIAGFLPLLIVRWRG